MMGRRPAPCPLPPAYDPLPNAQGEKTRPDWIIRKDFNGKADFMESLLSRHKDVYEITKEDQLGQRSEDLMLSALWQFMPLSCGFSPSVKLGRALITSWWWHEHELIEGVAVEVWMFLQLKKKLKWNDVWWLMAFSLLKFIKKFCGLRKWFIWYRHPKHNW